MHCHGPDRSCHRHASGTRSCLHESGRELNDQNAHERYQPHTVIATTTTTTPDHYHQRQLRNAPLARPSMSAAFSFSESMKVLARGGEGVRGFCAFVSALADVPASNISPSQLLTGPTSPDHYQNGRIIAKRMTRDVEADSTKRRHRIALTRASCKSRSRRPRAGDTRQPRRLQQWRRGRSTTPYCRLRHANRLQKTALVYDSGLGARSNQR